MSIDGGVAGSLPVPLETWWPCLEGSGGRPILDPDRTPVWTSPPSSQFDVSMV